MMRNAFLLSAILMTAGVFTAYSDFSSQPVTQGESVLMQSEKHKAPSFSFQSITGKTHDIEKFKDKVIVLNFWASWCAPCVVEFPQMINLARMTKEKSVFVFLSVDDNKDDIERFLKRFGKDLPPNVYIGWDQKKEISQTLFGTYKLPETFILSRDLTIEEKIIGADIVWDSPDMQMKIDNLYTLP